MSEDLSRKRLGRGLAALIGEIDRPAAPEKPPAAADGKVPIEFLSPNPRNPRRHFGDAELTDLAQSIREHGVVQPVVARPAPGQSGRYEIIAGERRWRAAQRAGLTEIPVIVRDVNDRTALELAIIENVQHADLNPVEEALGYQQLIDEHGYTQADLGQVIGKSRSHVANTLRLSKLPEPVRRMVSEGAVSAGHARALLSVSDPELMAKKIVAEGMSVRDIERVVQEEARGETKSAVPAKPRPEKDPDTRALEKALEEALGLSTTISHRQNGAGEVRIAYKTLEQLDALCRRLKA